MPNFRAPLGAHVTAAVFPNLTATSGGAENTRLAGAGKRVGELRVAT